MLDLFNALALSVDVICEILVVCLRLAAPAGIGMDEAVVSVDRVEDSTAFLTGTKLTRAALAGAATAGAKSASIRAALALAARLAFTAPANENAVRPKARF